MNKTNEKIEELRKENEDLNTKLERLSDNELKQVTGGVEDEIDRYSYWYSQVQQIMNSVLSIYEKENKFRQLLAEINNDNKIEKTDKDFLKEQINSLIGVGGR